MLDMEKVLSLIGNKEDATSLLPALLPSLLPMILGSPESMQEIVHSTVEQYKPVLYAVLKELNGLYEDLAENKGYYATQAALKRNMYVAYIDAGFTEEQAMVFLLDSAARKKESLTQMMSVLQNVSSGVSQAV